jgi:hypothetical protein
LMLGIEFDVSSIFLDDSEANRLGHNSLLRSSPTIKFVNGFKLEVEGKFRLVEVLRMSFVGVEDGEEQVGE